MSYEDDIPNDDVQYCEEDWTDIEEVAEDRDEEDWTDEDVNKFIEEVKAGNCVPEMLEYFKKVVDEGSDPELVRHSEMWELIVQTIFEIASITIPSYLGKRK